MTTRWALSSLVLLATLTPASAANPCKAACKSTKAGCMTAAGGAFATAKAACATSPTPPERRACMKVARASRTSAKAACKQTFKGCIAACPKGGGGGPPTSGSCNASGAGGWLAALNLYRSLAGLPAVVEDPTLSAGDLAHAKYVVRNDVIGHSEDASKPGYTDEGNLAASRSNVAAASQPTMTETGPIDLWMRGPYHAIGILDPTLTRVGFGIAHDSSGSMQSGAALDVLTGRGGSTAGVSFPILFPGDGTRVPLDRYDGTENPDPLASCPGYTAPTGLPLIVQLPPNVAPNVTSSSVTRDGAAVEHCVFAGSPGDSLGNRRAVVIIPKDVLRKGATYQATLAVGGETYTWSFSLACQ